MVRIEISQRRWVEDGPDYKVRTSVTYSQGIDRNIFVYNTQTQVFGHVASVWDMDAYPPTYAEAVSQGKDFYRQSYAEVSYGNDLSVAITAAGYTRGRVGSLAIGYQQATDDFEGDSNYVYEGE